MAGGAGAGYNWGMTRQGSTEPVERPGDGARWESVVARDARADGTFVFAVRTTGIYCRPSCPARRPRRPNVLFFATPDAAEAGGFRPCRRCHPRAAALPRAAWVRRVARAIESAPERATLARLAATAGVGPHHLQRTFRRTTGLTPRQYAEALRLGRLRRALRGGAAVEEAAHEAGYGSPSRAHARATRALGMSPGAYRRGGAGMDLAYTIVDSPLGRLLVAATPRGVSAVYVADDDRRLERELREEYPRAALRRDDAALASRVRPILAHLEGSRRGLEVPLDVQATDFQRRVWQELVRIPAGETRTYGEVARAIGRPEATRAVARACATNPVSIVVPCHRVVGADGRLTGYRWGTDRKARLLEIERRPPGSFTTPGGPQSE
jgi:AraC family transcriptional regulator of adaptative response/methylated-DNA-[protein]-cysteine methyltransferase